MSTMLIEPRLTLTKFVAGEIRAEMARQGARIGGLAELLNVSYATARLKFHGRRPLNVDELLAIADWLGVDFEQFFTGPGGTRAEDCPIDQLQETP